MAVLLGLAAAVGWGASDFLGGSASRRSSTASIVFTSQAVALVLVVPLAFLGGGDVTARCVLFGGLAGVFGLIGIGCLYRGLAIGRMGVVAPTTAMGGAVIPIAWALVSGERPAPIALAGIAILVVAGGLIGMEHDEHGVSTTRSLLWAAGAATGFGVAVIALAETGSDSGMWPLLFAQIVTVVGALVAVAVLGGSYLPTWPGPERYQAAGAGTLDIGATALLLVALRLDLVALVAPVASLAPAITVILAWWFLDEPVGRVQLVGIVAAVTGLGLIASG